MRGFDGHKLVRGRKRHILVDTLRLPISSRVEPANVPDQKASARLLTGLPSTSSPVAGEADPLRYVAAVPA